MTKSKFSIRSISMCLITCLMVILLGLASATVALAAEAETTVELPTESRMELFTESDYLYDSENQMTNTSYTIGQYDNSLWGVKTGNDDMIVQIVPRECFYNVCSFTHIGKEYGFYISTENTSFTNAETGEVTYGYKSDVFVFDISVTIANTGNEFSYKVTPLYVFNYYADDNGVRPQTTYKPDLSNLYYITNVNYGFTVLNENSYNSQDEYGYVKENDKGPVILQTRYNSSGYDGTDWQGNIGESIYITISRFGGYIPVVGQYIGIATDLIDIVRDSDELSQLIVWEKTEVANNNELNIITYKDKHSYANDETYYRSSLILANGEIVYKSGLNHYSEGILLLSSIEESYRIYDQIQLDIATVDTWGNRTIISSGNRCDNNVYNNNFRENIVSETSDLVYTLPYGVKKYSFTPAYTGYYNFNHSTEGNYEYYVYSSSESKGSSLTNTSEIHLEKDKEYYIDIVNLDNAIYANTFEISLQELTKGSLSSVLLNSNKSISFKYSCNTTEILDLKSSNSNIVIKNIINLNNNSDSLLNVNAQSASKKFLSGYTYIIEVGNESSSNNVSSNISLNELSNIPSFYNPSDTMKYFSFNSTSAAYYLFSFKYDVSELGIEILSSTLNSKSYEEGFGPGYKTVKIYLNANEKIYIGLYDTSEYSESVEIKSSFDRNAYKWKVNGSYISGNSIELAQGKSATLELVINDSISVKSFQIDNADYKYTTSNNTITLDAHCRISNYFEVKAVLEDSSAQAGINLLSVGKFYSESLFITPVLSSTYTVNTFSRDDGYGITWTNSYITGVEFKITAGSNTKTITATSTAAGNIMSTIKGWNYYNSDKISIVATRIQIKGNSKTGVVYDWVSNNTKGLSIPILYINALFGSGDGTSSSPFIITCQRHLKNLAETSYYDDIDGVTYFGAGYFKLGNDITLTNNWIPLGSINEQFVGTLDGNGSYIKNLNITTTNDGYFGLFAINSGTIKNVILSSVNINVSNKSTNNSGPISFVGAVCGINKSSIVNVKVYGTLTGSGRTVIGGIAGSCDKGTISSSTNNATIYGGNAIGGIVGSTSGGNVTGCYSYGIINYNNRYSDNDQIGGIAGDAEFCAITNCVVTSEITISIKDWESRTYQPRVGTVVGNLYQGTISRNTTTDAVINANNLNADVSWWSWFVTYHFNQKEYVKDGAGYTY